MPFGSRQLDPGVVVVWPLATFPFLHSSLLYIFVLFHYVVGDGKVGLAVVFWHLRDRGPDVVDRVCVSVVLDYQLCLLSRIRLQQGEDYSAEVSLLGRRKRYVMLKR